MGTAAQHDYPALVLREFKGDGGGNVRLPVTGQGQWQATRPSQQGHCLCTPELVPVTDGGGSFSPAAASPNIRPGRRQVTLDTGDQRAPGLATSCQEQDQ